MDIEERISPQARRQLAGAIQEAGGREVMAVGRLSPEGVVEGWTIAARGDEESVPAPAPFMEAGDVVIHNHPTGPLSPSRADLSIASRLGQEGIGFYITNNSVTKLYVASEPVQRQPKVPLNSEALGELIDRGGRLSRLISYEVRESQIEMLKETAAAFNEDRILAAEAGTGVGKSFAYLIPAASWAVQNKERVVISTATINLQEQLMDKDIPLVQKLLQTSFKAVLVKGRGNYLCRRRLAEALREETLFQEENDELARIRDWANDSPTGCRSDLNFYPGEDTWPRICSEADGCMGLHCPDREQCFVIKARKEAASANILVVNHHLLFSDLSLRLAGAGFTNTAVLPPFHRIIFDEAHNIERSATSFFSREFSRFSLLRLLSRLLRKTKGREAGIWPGLLKLLLVPPEGAEEMGALVRQAARNMEELEKICLDFLGKESALRFCQPPGETPRSYGFLLIPLSGLAQGLLRIQNRLAAALGPLAEEAPGEKPGGLVYEARMILHRLGELVSISEAFQIWEERPEDIFWMERKRTRRGEEYLRLAIAPLDTRDIMRRAVFEPYKTVICTSATLSVKDSFEYWARSAGLSGWEEREVRFLRFPSPFPYRQNVLLGVPTDAPSPEERGFSPFLGEMILKSLSLSGGHGLVLFTSYSQLQETFAQIHPALEDLRIPLLKQGDDERTRLLEAFRRSSESVLFATSSFWEGVDAPGESLQMVIICRLPFQAPTDPVLSARAEALERRGGQPFWELSLPEAVMRLKQGFGRLMRSSTDRGVVLILDPRVIRKAYGGIFLESLPETRRSLKESSRLLGDIEGFLFESRG